MYVIESNVLWTGEIDSIRNAMHNVRCISTFVAGTIVLDLLDNRQFILCTFIAIAEAEKMEIIDKTETNLVALRRTIYLTIQSSLDFEECAHKMLRMDFKPGQEVRFLVEWWCNLLCTLNVVFFLHRIYVRPGKKRDCFAQKACLESPKSVKKRDLKKTRKN